MELAVITCPSDITYKCELILDISKKCQGYKDYKAIKS